MDALKEAVRELKLYNYRKASLKNITKHLAELEDRTTRLKSSGDFKEVVSFGGMNSGDQLINLLSEIEDLKHNYNWVNHLINRVDRGLELLSPEERLVLEKFYIRRTRRYLDELIEELFYERTSIYRMKDEALRKFTIALYGIERL